MPEELLSGPSFLLVVSALLLTSTLLKVAAHRVRIPPVVGYIGLGLGLRVLDDRLGILAPASHSTLEFLAELGVVSLLFHVGLRSNLAGLLEQLPRSVTVWTSNVLISAGAGYAASRLLGFGPAPSAFVGAALSATSVAVSVAVWEDVGAIRSKMAELLLDVAELDDISAIILLLAAVAVSPVLINGGGPAVIASAALATIGPMLMKLLLFVAGCWLFSLTLERRVTQYFARFRRSPDPLLVVLGFGFGIAALAGWLGFSVAVGALFAGLMFSRDPEAVRMDAGFETIYALFAPFFFIDIGYSLEPGLLADSAALGVFVFAAAAIGKVLGGGLPLLLREGVRPALVLGVSLTPRAEIALLIVRTGKRMEPSMVPDALYGGVVFAAAAASIAAPLVLQRLLARWPETLGIESAERLR